MVCTGLQWAVLTVDSEIIGHSHGANWVADSTLVGAVVGAVNRLYEHCLVAHGEADSATVMERPAVLHPQSCADGAGGLTAEVGGAFIFYQDGCGAADGGSGYQRWQNTRVSIRRKWLNKRNRCTQRNRKHTHKKCDNGQIRFGLSEHSNVTSI